MLRLSGRDVGVLTDALASAFVGPDDLELYVHASTGDRLYVEYVNPGKTLTATIYDLLIALEIRGTTQVFLRYVYDKRPRRQDLRDLIAQLVPGAAAPLPEEVITVSTQVGGKEQDNAPTNALAPGLQRNVKPSIPDVDAVLWPIRMLEMQPRVCRVDRDGSGIGTGFLVGPDAVLTNWHVVQTVRAEGKLSEIACRFDYVRLNDRVNLGQLVPVRPDGCLTFSPHSAAELTEKPESPSPTLDELDFALLQLDSTAGHDTLPRGKRGWIVLPQAQLPLPEDSPLVILQHPEREPMKMILDTKAVIGANANGTRVKYNTSTERGSSGSPCFTMDWDIVALHHYGDPRWQPPLLNQGIPISLVRQRIEAEGFGNMLGN